MSTPLTTSGPWVAAAAAAVFLPLAALASRLRAWRRTPAGFALALALALLLAFEAALANALSAIGAVGRPGELGGHLALLLALLAWRPRQLAEGARRAARSALRPPARPLLLALPILALALVSALRFAPNNWDSMTYHLARVAHWLQRGSVGPYPTHVTRQFLYPPGPEYLILALQAIAGSDRLAFAPQLCAWLAVAAAAGPLARRAGAPAWLAGWAWLLAAAAPMAALQATSTQTDLVASAMALACLAAARPFPHRRRARPGPGEAALLAAAVAATVLVKAPAALMVLPFLLLALAAWSAPRPGLLRGVGPALLAVLLVLAAALGPELVRQHAYPPPGEIVTRFVYPPLGQWGDRALNVVRGVLRHFPVPRAILAPLAPFPHRMCGPGDLICTLSLRPHEDYAGNPLQVLALLGAAGLVAWRWRTLPLRARHAAVAWLGGFLLLHLTLRENEYFARLQLPLFALGPALLGAACGLGPPRARWARRLALVAGAALLASGVAAAWHNEARPPLLPWPVAWSASYYLNRQAVRTEQDRALRAIGETGCERLGLFILEDSYDYPLTWRALQRGAGVRHVTGPDAWPCLVYSDRGPPPPAGAWVPWSADAAPPTLFVPRR